MRLFIYLFLTLALASLAGIFDANLASAAEAEEEESDLDRGLVVCSSNASDEIMCNCKQGTQACTDMIKNSCGKSGASCAGGYCSCEAKDSFITRPSQATVRDHRTTESQVVAPSEKRLNLRIGQPLKLDGGKSLVLRPSGILEIVGMNGLVDRSFRDATIIEDRSGVIWILSGRKRWRVGLTQEQADLRRGILPTEERLISPNNIVSPNNVSGARGAVRDHRTTQGTVRDHRTTAPQSNIFTAELTPTECAALGGDVEYSRNCSRAGDPPLTCKIGERAVCIDELDPPD